MAEARKPRDRTPVVPTIISGLAVLGTSVGLLIAARSLDVASDSLRASEQALKAQSLPLLQGVPRGGPLPRPDYADFYASRPAREIIRFRGEVVMRKRVDGTHVSIPIRNVGQGTAILNKVWTPIEAKPKGNAGIYLAPGQEYRYSANVNGLSPADTLTLNLRYTDFSEPRTHWIAVVRFFRPPDRNVYVLSGTATKRRASR